MAKIIEITKGLCVLVDDEDYALVSERKWTASTQTYKGKSRTYARSWRDGSSVSLHRFLMKPAPRQHVDHINGDSLDNRRSNLRLCTPAENSANRAGWGPSYKGVYFCARYRNSPWRARITYQGQVIELGQHATAEAAAKAYDAHASLLHGDFATLNFPPG